jgi:hypothetical protein
VAETQLDLFQRGFAIVRKVREGVPKIIRSEFGYSNPGTGTADCPENVQRIGVSPPAAFVGWNSIVRASVFLF